MNNGEPQGPAQVIGQIAQGYTFEEPAIELGVLMHEDAPQPDAGVGSRSRC